MADLNVDFMGNPRGKCKDPNCDCTQYIKSDNKACSMCGCFPGKHELIVKSTNASIPTEAKNEVSPSKLNVAIESAMDQITPSKIVELHLDSGAVAIVPRKVQFDNGATSGAKKSAIDDGSLMEVEEEVDDPDDPDFVPDKENSSMEAEDQIEKEAVTTSRNVDGGVAGFSAAAIKSGFLSVDLRKKIEEYGVLKNETAFMCEAGSYLLSLSKKDKPNKEELTIFSSVMVDIFPELKSTVGKCAWAAFKTSLSRHLVQRRYRSKTRTPPKGKAKKSCAIVPKASAVNPKDEAQMLAELKLVTKKYPADEVLKLIEKTSTSRRLSMATQDKFKTPSEVLEMWPHLSVPEWLIYDFFSFKELEEEAFEANVADFLRRLAKLAFDEAAEEGSADSLAFMAKKLMYKQTKSVQSIVTVIEPMGSLAPLQPVDKEAPRLVLGVRGKELDQCYLLFDGVRMELQEPTASQAVTLLMAAYYLFDIRYPDPFMNFLTVLEIECLKKPNTIKASQRTLFKFVRDLQCV